MYIDPVRHSGRPAKIPVDLEGRMGIPQVGQRTALQQQAEEMICMIPIPCARPGVQAVRHGPAGAPVPAQAERPFGGFHPGGGF